MKRRHAGKLNISPAARRSAGFTLLELVVTMAVLVIVLAVGIIGVGRWTRKLSFDRQNNYARTLFVAAQNQLTEYETAGTIGLFRERFSGSAGLTRIASESALHIPLKDLHGSAMTLDTIWAAAKQAAQTVSGEGAAADPVAYRGTIVGVILTPEDYAAYLSGTGLSRQKQAVYDLFSDYVYDLSVLNANICVEFSPEAGMIFSVLYSDQTAFSYNDTWFLDRSAASRRGHMTGYYGVDQLARSTSAEQERPVISDLKLINDDTLYLRFRLKKIPAAMGQLNFDLVVYDSPSHTPLLTVTLPAGQLKNAPASPIVCQVRYPQGKNLKPDAGARSYALTAYVGSDGYARVVLDAADLAATSQRFYDEYTDLADRSVTDLTGRHMPQTLSFHRFGVETEDIYCTVQGYADYYQTTAAKKSNTENTYFAGTALSDDRLTCTIRNARHLYNVRYIADSEALGTYYNYTAYSAAQHLTCRVAADISWPELTELYSNNGAVMTTPLDIGALGIAFPSFRRLRAGDIFEGRAGTLGNRVTISGLRISADANGGLPAANAAGYDLYPSIFGTSAADTGAGLFLRVYGDIHDLRLDGITVTGTENVGAFAAVDCGGALRDLTVGHTADASAGVHSVISGRVCVGGITGAYRESGAGREAHYSGLTNYAEISESAGPGFACSFGGIIGELAFGAYIPGSTMNAGTIELSDCANYGILTILPNTPANEAFDIGGIAGYCDSGTTAGGVTQITLRQCFSAPQYTAELLDPDALTARLNGRYVGGIVGCNNGADIIACATRREGRLDGFILGNRFVGGIVGYSEHNGELSGLADGALTDNQCHVIGREYVGGIVGRHDEGTVIGWRNTGFVGATEGYAGGIAGYNEATILRCASAVASSGTAETLAEMPIFENSAFAGGIAGYNSGVLRYDLSGGSAVVSNIAGGRFVGGAIGYNDTAAVVEGYTVGGCVVSGRSYVGGFAGVNTSVSLLGDVIRSNPSRVSGTYCVGGTLGANVVAPSGDLTTDFRSENFLGSVSGSVFVGGVVGCNQLAAPGSDLLAALSASADRLEALPDGATYAELMAALPQLPASTRAITFRGDGMSTKTGGVRARLFVGGILGICAEGTTLTIRDFVNMSPVAATAGILNPGESDGLHPLFTYSYAGGIMGRVSETIIVDNCRNYEQGMVTAHGSYTGGLCEVNAGTIQNCRVSNLGANDISHVGGLTGLNKGTVKDCVFAGDVTVTGSTCVGGIAAENLASGAITGITVSGGIVTGYGDYVGGLVGVNEGVLRPEDGTLNVLVETTGRYAGGVAGASATAISGTSDSLRLAITGRVTGGQYAGGAVGLYTGTGIIRYITNNAAVSASDGYAGGILGQMERTSGSVIDCVNTGTVSAPKGGTAGGILAENAGRISNCADTGIVSAANGVCGGIAGVNLSGGSVIDCAVGPASGTLAFTGLETVGGVVGMNEGRVSGCSARALTLSNLGDSPQDSAIGAIAGISSGTITGGGSGPMVDGCVLTGVVSAADIGAIAGISSGTITGGDSAEVTNTSLLLQTGLYGSVGGAVGQNSGRITGLSVCADVAGQSGYDQRGYGGIAGVSAGIIEACHYSGAAANASTSGENSVSGTIHGVWSASTSANPANVGGIVGYNTGDILDCLVGTEYATAVYGSNTSNGDSVVGGLAGWNLGSVISCDNRSTQPVAIIGYKGHAGGIVGKNVPGGIVTGRNGAPLATGSNWSVTLYKYSNDCGCGGIIGYSGSGMDMEWVINHANATSVAGGSDSNSASGGIIGRFENNDSASTVISYCVNYGDITSKKGPAAGIIGRGKFNAADILYCVNYGSISGSGDASGILGGLADKSISRLIQSCYNFGNIKGGSYTAGILGNNENREYIISDCVNVGAISGSGAASGIFGRDSAGVRLYRCRSYGPVSGNADRSSLATRISAMDQCLAFSDVYNKLVKANGGSGTPRNYTVLQAADESTVTPNTTYILAPDAGGTLCLADDTPVGGPLTVTVADVRADKTQAIPVTEDIPPLPADEHVSGTGHLAGENARQRAFEEFDTAFARWVSGGFSGTPSIKSSDITIAGSAVTVKWTPAGSYYDQELFWRYADEADYHLIARLGYGVTSFRCDITDEWAGRDIVFRIVNYDYDRTASAGAEASKNIHARLPEPQVHMEFIGDKGFVAVLENPEDYISCAAQLESGQFIRIRVTVTNESGSSPQYINIDLTGADPENWSLNSSNAIFNIDSTANANHFVNFSAAVYKGSTEQTAPFYPSAEGRIHCQTQSAKILRSDYSVKVVGATLSGISGTMPADLTISLSVSTGASGSKLEHHVISDCLAEGFFAGTAGAMPYAMDLVVDYGLNHATRAGSITTTLSDLPAGLWLPRQDGTAWPVQARVYLWQGQGYMHQYGHPVTTTETLTLEMLEGYIALTGQDGQLMDEHWIDTSGTPAMRPNPVFRLEGGTVTLNDGYQLRMEKDGTYTIIYSSLLADPDYTPQIGPNGIGTGSGVGLICLQNTHNPAPDIHITLPAGRAAGAELTDVDTTDSMTVTWDTSGPSFSQDAAYSYVIRGTYEEDGQQKTTIIDYGDYYTNADKSLTDKNDHAPGTYINELVYPDITGWRYTTIDVQITRGATTAGSAANARLPAASRVTAGLKQRLSQVTAPTAAIVSKNDLIYHLTWASLPPEERDHVAGYIATVTAEGMEPVSFAPYVIANTDDSSITVPIDLSDFNGKTVEISVRALASGSVYRDSPAGVPMVLKITNRLSIPAAENLTMTPDYDSVSYLTLDALRAPGLRLTYAGQPDGDTQARYELRLTVCDEQTREPLAGASEISVTMDGDLTLGTYDLTGAEAIGPEYAGRLLRADIRAVSDINVSSYWTGSQDEYAWLRIPAVQTACPGVEVQEAEDFYTFETSIGSERTISFYRQLVTIDPADYADGCDITLVRHGASTAAGYTVRHVDFIHVTAGGDVTWYTSDPTGHNDWRAPLAMGSVHDGVELEAISARTDVATVTIPTHATLWTEDGKLMLLLPDVLGGSGSDTVEPNLTTEQLTVRAVADDTSRYVSSRIRHWNRANGLSEQDALTGYPYDQLTFSLDEDATDPDYYVLTYTSAREEPLIISIGDRVYSTDFAFNGESFLRLPADAFDGDIYFAPIGSRGLYPWSAPLSFSTAAALEPAAIAAEPAAATADEPAETPEEAPAETPTEVPAEVSEETPPDAGD